MRRGDIANLNTQYLIDIEQQGDELVKCELAVFKPEAEVVLAYRQVS